MKYKDFELISEGENSDRFTLYKKKKIPEVKIIDNKQIKTGKDKITQIIVGYGFTFERALKRICTLLTIETEQVTIEKHIEKYAEILKEIKNVLK